MVVAAVTLVAVSTGWAGEVYRWTDVQGVLHAVWFCAVSIKGVATPTFGTETLGGNVAPVVLTGRAPRTQTEIAFGPVTLDNLKLHVGDRVPIGDKGARATVVGTALLPESSVRVEIAIDARSDSIGSPISM